jgi:hypothetical protein
MVCQQQQWDNRLWLLSAWISAFCFLLSIEPQLGHPLGVGLDEVLLKL